MTQRTPFDLFRVECGEGWQYLYLPLLELAELYGADVLQVKEKFGGLRFYFTCEDPERAKRLEALVAAAEEASFHTCEDCGEDGSDGWDWEKGKNKWKAKRRSGVWIRTLCDSCAEKAGKV